MTNLEKAMRAVRRGPEKKRVEVEGHHWNFKRAKWDRRDLKGGKGVVKGRISHNVRGLDDDQIILDTQLIGDGIPQIDAETCGHAIGDKDKGYDLLGYDAQALILLLRAGRRR